MIIQSQSSNKIRQSSMDSAHSSESDASYHDYSQLTCYISAAESTPESLAGEEVVTIKNEEIICETQRGNARIQSDYAINNNNNNEAEFAVLCLQAQEFTQGLNPVSPVTMNMFMDASRKRKNCASDDATGKKRKLGNNDKITVVYPVSTGIRNLIPVNQGTLLNNGNGCKATYRCPQCDKTFETDKYLSMHLSLHKYPENSKQTLESSKQQQQQQQAVFNAEFRTIKLAKKFDSSMNDASVQSQSLMPTMTAVNSPPSSGVNSSTSGHWTCPYCQKIFVQNSNFKNHVRTHSDERPFVCNICSIGFKERYHLKKHFLFKHTNDHKETCRVCGKRFKDSTAVRAHERIHSEVRPYGCALCGKTFKTSECLWHHENRSKTCGKAILAKQQQNIDGGALVIQRNFVQNGNVVPNVQPLKKQRRSKLSASLEAKEQMKKPDLLVSEHNLDGNLMDSVCLDESFFEGMWAQFNEVENSRQNLEDGTVKVDVSSKRSPMDCTTINNSINNNNNNGQSNTAELRPYKCKVCDNAFKLKVHLKKHHLYRHTNEYPCECSICGKKFKDTSAVRLHERIHSSERPFKCLTCGKSFKTRENLWGHKNRGPCDSKLVNQSPSVADAGGNVLKGKMKVIKSEELSVGVPMEGSLSQRGQNSRNFARVDFPTPTLTYSEQFVSTSGLVRTKPPLQPKAINPPQQHSGTLVSSESETSLAFHSNLNIPTAVVAPIRRPQSTTNLRTMAGSIGQGQMLSNYSEARRCPTIHSLLLSKGNKVIQTSGPASSAGMNSIKEQPRVLRLYNAPTDTLAILIPADSSQQFSMLDLNATVRSVAKQEPQRIPTLNTLLVRDFASNSTGPSQNVETHLATADNEIGDIFDFQVGDVQDPILMNLKDVPVSPNCGSNPCTLEELGQSVDAQSFDDMCMSGWSSDSSWFLGDDVSFLDDIRLTETVPAMFSQ